MPRRGNRVQQYSLMNRCFVSGSTVYQSASSSPFQRERRNSITGRMRMPSTTRAADSRQTTIRCVKRGFLRKAPQAGQIAVGDRSGRLDLDRGRVAYNEIDLGSVRGAPEGERPRVAGIGQPRPQLAEDEVLKGRAERRAAGCDVRNVAEHVGAADVEEVQLGGAHSRFPGAVQCVGKDGL